MKKMCLMIGLVCLICVPSFAWGPISHLNICWRIMSNSDISYQISRWGLSQDSIATAAEYADLNEPSDWHQSKWGDISSLANLNNSWMTSSRPITNDNVGYLMHNISDCAVPVNHCPACDVYNNTSWAENMFEVQGNAYTTPVWPDPPYYISDRSNYDTYVSYHVTNMHNLGTTFKNHNNSYWPCKYFHVCQTDWIDPDCRRAAFKFAWEVAYWVLANHT